MNVLSVLLKDGYKVGHRAQYPSDTTLIYSNLTPRVCRESQDSIGGVINFGEQYFVKEYLINQFNRGFFEKPLDEVMRSYKRRINNYLGPDAITFDHIEALHTLGYLPLKVKTLPEGTLVPYRVPVLTICNTHKDFFWLTNMLETLLSCVMWKPLTSATTAFRYRINFEKFAKLTGTDPSFIQWQGHDFSFRGMCGPEDAALSGAAHLLSFTGTDTIPAIDFLEEYYGADCEKELIGGSVPATEHSVMSMGSKDGEIETIKRLITEVYPKGVVSIVSDTWDFWKVITEYLPALKDIILAREGKVVIRPDSGDPVKIICGDPFNASKHVRNGAITELYKTFPGPTTSKGYMQLDPHIGLIYGDSITIARQDAILKSLQAQGFASSNVVLGIGSYTYQFCTRDTHGLAMKATYGETVSGGPQPIFKDPATDNGVKKSAKGLLRVGMRMSGQIILEEDCTWEEEGTGLLKTVFENGSVHNFTALSEVRARVAKELERFK